MYKSTTNIRLISSLAVAVTAPLPQPNQASEFETLLESWFDHCRALDLSEKTISHYAQTMGKFIWWLGEFLPEALDRPGTITPDHMTKFLIYLRTPAVTATRWGEPIRKNREKLAPGTVSSFGRVLTNFFNWLTLDRRYLDLEKSPMERISSKFSPPSRKGQAPAPTAINEIELKKLAVYLNLQSEDFTGSRDRAMILFMLDTGVRRGELLSIRYCDLDLAGGECFVTGKTGGRTVYFSRKTADIIRDFQIRFRQDYDKETTPFWITSKGRPLGYSALGRLVHGVKEATGIALHPHKLRHTFATHMADRVDPFSLQKMMGHSSISTTMRYVHLSGEQVKRAYKGNSPLETMDIGEVSAVKRRRGRPRK
jgi:integrase/recombinase XerC